MKYCPYCGAEILSGAFSFCPSCGEPLPVLAQTAAEKPPGKPSPQREKTKKERTRKRERLPRKPKQLILSEVETLDYDGYYEDVQPIDADRQREGVDTRLILRVVLLVAGVALVIGGCVAALFCCESCKQPDTPV